MTSTDELFTPGDADEAHETWKANCGPCAFAAVLGRPVMAVREFFPRYPRQPWTNPTHMKAALNAAGVRWKNSAAFDTRVPLIGLAFVQWDGPWCRSPETILQAYRHTHWIGMSGSRVYDVNAGGWLSMDEWQADIVPLLLEHTPGATGWWVRSGLDVFPSKAGAA